MPLLNTADALRLGSSQVTAAYLGATKLWPSAPPPEVLLTETWDTNGPAWPTAWTTQAASGGAVNVAGNRGILQTPTSPIQAGVKAYLTSMTSTVDTDVVVDVLITGSQLNYLVIRAADSAAGSFPNGYQLRVTTSATISLEVSKRVGGVVTSLSDNQAGGPFTGSGQRLRFQAVGNTIRIKSWAIGATEPAAWLWTGTDSSLAGVSGRLWIGSTSQGVAGSQTSLDNLVVSTS